MKLKTFARRAAAAGAVLAALTLAALPALAAPKVQVSTTNAVADHADILSDETEQYVNDVSIKLSDACGAQIGVYTLDELLGSTTMEGFAYDVFNAWGLGSDDLDNGVLLLLAPNEADGGDYYIMRGDGLESQLSFSTLGSLLDEYMEPYWVNGDYDTGTQKTVQALADRYVVFHDDYGAVSRLLLELIRAEALARGYHIITCPCAMHPEDQIDHIFIPALRLAFLTDNLWHPIQLPGVQAVRCTRFVDRENLSGFRARLRFNDRAASELIDQAVALMAQAKNCHDELETYYRAAVDFDQVNAVAANCQKILGLG